MKLATSCTSITLALGMAFLTIQPSQAAFIAPTFVAGSDDYVTAEWDVFTELSLPNHPDISLMSGGLTSAPSVTDYAIINNEPSALITSTANIYSFAAPIDITLESNFVGLTPTNIMFQFKSLVNQADYDSLALTVQTTEGTQILSPGYGEEISSALGEVEYGFQWNLSSLNLTSDVFNINYVASGSSMSLDRARLDYTGNDATSVQQLSVT